MAHKAITGSQNSSGRGIQIRQKQVQIAGVGSGGSQRSSSVKNLKSSTVQILRDGGWSEEEIKEMEQRKK